MIRTPGNAHGSVAGALVALLATVATAGADTDAERIDAFLDERLPALVETYRHLHEHPELSLQEEKTAALVASKLEAAGYTVQTGVGGHGVVGVLKNGPGPTLFFRGDMDALPVTEATGLPYASTVQATREDGTQVGVMHACGHDIHTTVLVGLAQILASTRDQWSGTLVMVGEPAEELGRGALAMLDDGIFDRVPRPDVTLALHVVSALPAGKVGITSGWTGANVDAVWITIFGRGGHGSRPHETIDPITTSAYLITQLQTLVSRRVDPLEAAVVSVGAIHGGERHNVIPDQVKLSVTVRSYTDEVRSVLIEGIRQLTRDTCLSFQCPRPPEVRVREFHTPAMYNDPELVERARALFRRTLGDDALVEPAPSMGGDDFGRFGKQLGVPSLYLRLGSIDPTTLAASEAGGPALPALHSAGYQPAAEPTLRTGIAAMSHLALELLDRR